MVPTKHETVKIILDANFFFLPLQFNLNIFEELANMLNQRFEPVLLSSTLKELHGLAESSSPQTQKRALLALRMAEKCSFVPVEKFSGESYDDVIVRVSTDWKVPVGTNDKKLKKRLRQKGIAVIFLRQKHRLVIEGTV